MESPKHLGGRIRVVMEFDVPNHKPSTAALRKYIKESLEWAGGSRMPEDPLFNSLGNVRIGELLLIARPKPLVWMSGPVQAVKKGAYSYGPVPKREQLRVDLGDVIVAKDRKTKEIVFCERRGKPYRGKVR